MEGPTTAGAGTIDAVAAAAPRGLRSLGGDSLVYGLSIALLPVALILATPVLTRRLGTEAFGVVDVLAGLVGLATIVAGLGIDYAVSRTWFERDDETFRREIVSTGLVVAVTSAVIVAVICAAAFALASEDNVAAATLAFAAIPLLTAQSVARLAFLLTRRRLLYLLAALVHAVVGAGAAVVLVLAHAGAVGYFVGVAAGALAALAFTLSASGLIRARQRSLVRSEVARMLRFGLPLVPAAAAVWTVFAVDRAIVATARGFDEAGLYGLGAKVTAPMMLLTSAFAVAWGPFILAAEDRRRPELRARALTVVVATVGAVLLVLVLAAPELVRLLGGGDFAGAERAVPGVGLGWLGWAAATVLATEFSVRRKTWPLAVATSVSAAANVVLNIALVPRYGFVAAAWVTAASFALLAAIYAAWERRLGAAPYRLGRLALVAAIVAGALAALAVGDRVMGVVVVGVSAVVLLAVAASEREQPPAAARPRR